MHPSIYEERYQKHLPNIRSIIDNGGNYWTIRRQGISPYYIDRALGEHPKLLDQIAANIQKAEAAAEAGPFAGSGLKSTEYIKPITDMLQKKWTLGAIGKELGITGERVRQITNKHPELAALRDRTWTQFTPSERKDLHKRIIKACKEYPHHTNKQIADLLGISLSRVASARAALYRAGKIQKRQSWLADNSEKILKTIGKSRSAVVIKSKIAEQHGVEFSEPTIRQFMRKHGLLSVSKPRVIRHYSVKYNGKKMTLLELSRQTGVLYQTLLYRIIKKKWPVRRAIETPPRVLNIVNPKQPATSERLAIREAKWL